MVIREANELHPRTVELMEAEDWTGNPYKDIRYMYAFQEDVLYEPRIYRMEEEMEILTAKVSWIQHLLIARQYE